jgi:urease accessory protein
MKRLLNLRTLVLVAAVLAAPLAWGHDGHEVGSAASGFVHPFTGLDHLLAMVAIGLWTTQLGVRTYWSVPLAFVVAMALGALAGFAGFALPALEPMIAASVEALGLAIAAGFRAPVIAGVTIAALFAVFHGNAHGLEAAGAPIAAYMGGMLAATALLHGAGIAGALAVRGEVLRWTGVAVAAGGAGLMFAVA